MARGAGAAGRSRLTGLLPDGQWIKHGELAQEAGTGSRHGEHGGHADCEMSSSDAEASHPEQPDLRKRSEPQPGFACRRLRAIARRHDFREPEGGHACPERKRRTAARQKAGSPAAAAQGERQCLPDVRQAASLRQARRNHRPAPDPEPAKLRPQSAACLDVAMYSHIFDNRFQSASQRGTCLDQKRECPPLVHVSIRFTARSMPRLPPLQGSVKRP